MDVPPPKLTPTDVWNRVKGYSKVIESGKHLFENIFNTVMNVSGKTKDNEKA